MSALQMVLGALNYALHYSNKRRSIALQVAKGQLTVRAPAGVSVAEINALIAKKQRWIVKHLHYSQLPAKPDWLAQQQIPLHDNLLPLYMQSDEVAGVALYDSKVIVSLPRRKSAISPDAKVRQLLQQWYKQQAVVWFTERVGHWQQQMMLSASAIVIGNWKSKWGHCKSSAELGFNWRLMMAPDWVADYVIVHELAHLRYLNHSPRFWHLVQLHYPRHDEAKLWLKQHQHRLEL